MVTMLEDIGFYTLSNDRAASSSKISPLWRCELILTDKCNLSCSYCRKPSSDCMGTLNFSKAKRILKTWINDGLKNVRFSGGEPTLYKRLPDLISYCRDMGVERIAVSTNGTAKTKTYQRLYDVGVNDFSISLDSCCAADIDKIFRKTGWFDIIIENIKMIAKSVYTTIGLVITKDNIASAQDTIIYASEELGVSDIRIIPAAQFSKKLTALQIPSNILKKHPILKYRVRRALSGCSVRGINKKNCHECYLAMDDMVIVNDYHFPCIIYMREHGQPIGIIDANIRQARSDWVKAHNSYLDPICRNNCLDVCVEYNDMSGFLKNKNEKKIINA